MMTESREQAAPPFEIRQRIADNLFQDANERLRYQQGYSVEGFKTLILINGGAVIALLTYAGHRATGAVARQLSQAFLGYSGGLITAVLAYLAAYASQAAFMQHSTLQAYDQLGLTAKTTITKDDYLRSGNRAVTIGIVLSILSLLGFVAGSWLAMEALT